MISKAASDMEGFVNVTFSLPGAVGAERINLVGDFNVWDPRATPLTRSESDAVWRTTVRLPAGCRHRFRYLVDGTEWLNDWHADDYVENLCGSFDCVLDLTGYT